MRKNLTKAQKSEIRKQNEEGQTLHAITTARALHSLQAGKEASEANQYDGCNKSEMSITELLSLCDTIHERNLQDFKEFAQALNEANQAISDFFGNKVPPEISEVFDEADETGDGFRMSFLMRGMLYGGSFEDADKNLIQFERVDGIDKVEGEGWSKVCGCCLERIRENNRLKARGLTLSDVGRQSLRQTAATVIRILYPAPRSVDKAAGRNKAGRGF